MGDQITVNVDDKFTELRGTFSDSGYCHLWRVWLFLPDARPRSQTRLSFITKQCGVACYYYNNRSICHLARALKLLALFYYHPDFFVRRDAHEIHKRVFKHGFVMFKAL